MRMIALSVALSAGAIMYDSLWLLMGAVVAGVLGLFD